ncbi:hypothetical protein L1887_53609 [Cichorium endivia]|nr:hypothetical protein L1887_53609 [Cichorium endivia]
MSAPSTSKANGGNGATSSKAAPSPTLYVKNIEGKIKKPGKLSFRASSHAFFLTILSVPLIRTASAIVLALLRIWARAGRSGRPVHPGCGARRSSCSKTPPRRRRPKRALHSFVFYGKELHIDYATGAKSRAILRREIGHDAVHEMDLERSKTTVSRRGEKRTVESKPDSDDEEDAGRKRAKLDDADEKVVKALDVPEAIEVGVLQALFARQEGYVEVTVSEQKAGTWTAKVEFEDAQKARAAKDALNNIQLDPTYSLTLVTQ